MKVTKLNESKSDIHLYYDEFSGKTYIFDGKKLKEIDKSPDQNNRPTDEDEEARQQEHDRQQEAEKNEAGEGTKQRLEDPFENETEEERAERIKKTQDMFKNPDILKDLESEEEYTKNAEARSQRIKSSNKKEIKKFDGNLATFKTDLES